MSSFNTVFLIFFVFVTSVFSSCRRDPEEGPQGPQGEPGPGEMTSEFHTVQEDEWEIEDSVTYFAALEMPELTTEVLETGAVLVYLDEGNDDASFYTQLPLTFYLSDTLQATLEVNLSEQVVFVAWVNSQKANIGPGDMDFKVVVIDATSGSGGSRSSVSTASNDTARIDLEDHPEFYGKY